MLQLYSHSSHYYSSSIIFPNFGLFFIIRIRFCDGNLISAIKKHNKFNYISSLGNDKCFKRDLLWANQNSSLEGGICLLVIHPPRPPFLIVVLPK